MLYIAHAVCSAGLVVVQVVGIVCEVVNVRATLHVAVDS